MNILETIQDISTTFLMKTGHSIECITLEEQTYMNLLAEIRQHCVLVEDEKVGEEFTLYTASGPIKIEKGLV
jgi:hypothetical protein